MSQEGQRLGGEVLKGESNCKKWRKEEEKEKLNKEVTLDWGGVRRWYHKEPEMCFCTRVNVRQVSPFQKGEYNKWNNGSWKVICIERGGCRIGDMMEMTIKKKEESLTQLCRFFMPLPEQQLIPGSQQLTCQWCSWMTSLMQLIDRFRWCIGNQLSCYWLLINEWRPVMWEQLWRSEHENHCLSDYVRWIHEKSTLLSGPHWDEVLAVQEKTSG